VRSSRHPFDPGVVQRSLEIFAEAVEQKLVTSTANSEELGALALRAVAFAGFQTAVDPASDALRQALHRVGEATAALFAVHRAAGVALVMRAGAGVPRVVSGRTPESMADVGIWLTGWWAAATVDDQPSLAVLASTPVALLRESTTVADEFKYRFAEALQSYWQDDDRADARLLSALEATDPARVRIMDADRALDIHVPEIEVFHHVMARDPRAFDSSMAKALELHRGYWSHPSRRHEPDGFLPLGLVSLAHAARRAGLQLTVTSDYLPPGLIEREPPAPSPRCAECLMPRDATTGPCPACLGEAAVIAQPAAMDRTRCRHCQATIPAPASRCPQCRRRQAA
jgi:hypothetical protein